jgi:hypothetical protein
MTRLGVPIAEAKVGYDLVPISATDEKFCELQFPD